MITLPLHFEARLPLTTVLINEQPVTVMVDLGGFDTLSLTPAQLERLAGVHYTGASRRYRNAIGEIFEARELRLEGVKLGSQILAPLQAYEHLRSPDYGPPLAEQVGYLGLGLLSRWPLLIDYAAGCVQLGAAPSEEGWCWVELLPQRDTVCLPIKINGVRCEASLDTGSTDTLLHPARSGASSTSISLELGGTSLIIKEEELLLERFEYPEAALILGYSFFASYAVFIDPQGQRVGIRPHSSG